jgi:protein-tyrosine phosphatase
MHDYPSGRNAPGTFHTVIVCTANYCRSPLGEHLMRSWITSLGISDWTVESAGVKARPGLPPHPYVTEILSGRHIDVDGWSSQRVSSELIERADLILTATAAQRGQVVRLVPKANLRTFVLLQFADWCRHAATGLATGRTAGETAVLAALDGRGRSQPLAPAKQDLEDPLGHPLRRFEACADTLADATDAIVRAGRPPQGAAQDDQPPPRLST